MSEKKRLRRILVTIRRGQPLHSLWKNFLCTSPDGYEYVDIDGIVITSDYWGSVAPQKNSTIWRVLWETKKRLSVVSFIHKLLSELYYDRLIDAQKPDIVYCVNGRIYRGTRPWVVDFENVSAFFDFNVVSMRIFSKQLAKVFSRPNLLGVLSYSLNNKESFGDLFGVDLLSKVYIIPNVVPSKHINTAVRPDGKTLLFSGSINIEDSFFLRGGLEVLHVFKKLKHIYPDLKLVMRCAVPAEVESLAKSLGVDVISDRLSQEEYDELLRRTTVYVLPAYVGYALSLLDAMSFGIPVVTSDLVENREQVVDGHNGFAVEAPAASYILKGLPEYYFDKNFRPVIDESYIDRLSEAVKKILFDDKLRESISRNNVRQIDTHYSITVKNRLLKEVFDKHEST